MHGRTNLKAKMMKLNKNFFFSENNRKRMNDFFFEETLEED